MESISIHLPGQNEFFRTLNILRFRAVKDDLLFFTTFIYHIKREVIGVLSRLIV